MCDPGDDDELDGAEEPSPAEPDEGPSDAELDTEAAEPTPEPAPDAGAPDAVQKPAAEHVVPAAAPEPAQRRRLSSRDRQAEIKVLDALAKSLVALPQPRLEALGLDELTDVIAAARTKRKGARIRELRRIATALRQLDPEAIAQRLTDLKAPDRAEVARLKACETWRDRLLEGGDAVLSEFVEAHPTVDRQRLRQLVRSASRDRTQARSQHAYRELFREIRGLLAPASAPDEDE